MAHKLLYVASSYSHICNFHLPYLREFSRLGWVVDVACGGQQMNIPGADHVIHVPFQKNISLYQNRSALHQLRSLLHSGTYTLVSTHTSLASFFVRLASLGLKNRPKIVCMVHGYLFDEQTPALKRLLLSSAEKLVAPVTDLLLTMNDWDTCYARSHKLGHDISYIPGIGIPFNRCCSENENNRLSGTALRQKYALTSEDFVLIYGAEFSPRKSQETVIRAMAELPEHTVLLLPGDGALRTSCMALADSLGLANRVIFPGQVSDMSPWYAAADGAVSSSRSEGLPFNIMEAMHCRLPVVCTDVKGHVDLIDNQVSGLLFPYGDSHSCAQQIRRLLDDPELGKAIAHCACERVEQYALELVLPEIMDCYRRIVPLEPSPCASFLS